MTRLNNLPKEVIMSNLSNDPKINEMCNGMLRTGHWIIKRHEKHPILKHIAKGATKFFSIPCTPSDPRAYANFRRDYNRYIREFLIQTGVILAQ
jgi:hypothetical protein